MFNRLSCSAVQFYRCLIATASIRQFFPQSVSTAQRLGKSEVMSKLCCVCSCISVVSLFTCIHIFNFSSVNKRILTLANDVLPYSECHSINRHFTYLFISLEYCDFALCRKLRCTKLYRLT